MTYQGDPGLYYEVNDYNAEQAMLVADLYDFKEGEETITYCKSPSVEMVIDRSNATNSD